MRRIVIVGAGLAGLRAGEALRSGGFDGDLTIVGDETHPPYNRPPLSKQVLTGTVDPAECLFPAERLTATWLLGTRAVALDPSAQVVSLHDGRQVPYDGLVIATGCRARTWPQPVPAHGVHTLRSLDDCLALRKATSPDTQVAIVGAGFLGSEVAAALRARGVHGVSLIDTAPHPLPGLGPTLGARVAQLHTEHGVRLHLGTNVSRFAGGSRVRALYLADGTRVAADVVLLAVGATPNTDWLAGSGLNLLQGRVLCDERCVAVGADRIVAAGDVAAWTHPRFPAPVGLEHWSNAAEMGKAAAASLLNDPIDRGVFAPVPTFWTDQYDHKIKSVGWFMLGTDHTVVEDDHDHGRLVVEAYRQGALVGAVTVNKPRSHINYQRALAAALAPAS